MSRTGQSVGLSRRGSKGPAIQTCSTLHFTAFQLDLMLGFNTDYESKRSPAIINQSLAQPQQNPVRTRKFEPGRLFPHSSSKGHASCGVLFIVGRQPKTPPGPEPGRSAIAPGYKTHNPGFNDTFSVFEFAFLDIHP